ncbi:MAG: SDR family oxidoreductase [Chitinophagaceae bacterium]|nr:SDR family oxidoreductase [Chitinophagaceae bacterium]
MKNTVLILGAASDMGMAIARKYAEKGHSLQLAARNIDRLEPLCSDIQIRHNVACTLHELDITSFNSLKNFWESIEVKPQITISVIGYMNDNEKVITSEEETLKTINTNFTGLALLLNIIANDYAKNEDGVIAGVSSVAGMRGRQSNYIYGSAKAGFTAYLSGLRNKMYHHKVHVMTVLPGFVYTKMTEHLNLPKLLTANPENVASSVYNGLKKKKNIIFIKWFWRWIMLIITSVPEFIFKKKKL